MNTNRVYDISGRAVLFVVLVALAATVMAVYSPSLAMFQSEIYGYWASAAFAWGLVILYAYTWIYGKKTAAPICCH